jgi:hypothetical protein
VLIDAEAVKQRGGTYLLLSVLKSVNGRSLFLTVLSDAETVKERSLFINK